MIRTSDLTLRKTTGGPTITETCGVCGQLAATSEHGELLRGLREARLRYLLALVSSDPEERAKRDRYGAELAEWTERLEALLIDPPAFESG